MREAFRMKRAMCLMMCLMMGVLWVPCRAFADGYATGVWLPYWDSDEALSEADALAGKLDAAVAFACLFDSSDRPLMLPETEELLKDLKSRFKGTDTAVFLSIVNDIEVAEGRYDNKSVKLLQRLFATDEAMSAHLEALVQLIDDYALDGLELDYENLKKDGTLWASYTAFIQRAWGVCQRDGVRLRVVLPWDAPKYASLPEGPEYTVMCYNLYGTHSGPGPKADFAFLKTTCELYRNVPGTVRMAFATGGFDWSDGAIESLSQAQARAQLVDVGVAPTRDEPSGVLKASYTSDGVGHEVWYADGATLAAWRDTCAAYGYEGFDLFRLGGNDLDDWSVAFFAQSGQGGDAN
jgi:spore germination protein YaaH